MDDTLPTIQRTSKSFRESYRTDLSFSGRQDPLVVGPPTYPNLPDDFYCRLVPPTQTLLITGVPFVHTPCVGEDEGRGV